MGLFWQATQFRKRYNVDKESHNEQPRLALNHQQDSPGQDKTHQQIGQDGQEKFHADIVA